MEWLRALTAGPPAAVDTESHIIRGYVVAQLGTFKDSRGRFNDRSLQMIEQLGNAAPAGLKSRFGHPTLSDDGLGKYLGRAKNFQRDGDKVRADLHLSPAAAKAPAGDLRAYVEELASLDPAAFSSSLVLQTKKEFELAPDGKTRLKDDQGNELPPFWYPESLHASDVVDTGAAVDSFLASEDSNAEPIDPEKLPDALLRQAASALDQLFPAMPREIVAARLTAWVDRYLANRYGPAPTGNTSAGIPLAALRNRLRLRTR